MGTAWATNALAATSDANNYTETSTALTSTAADLNGSQVVGAGGGIVVVGAASGSAGAAVYYSSQLGAATTANSTLLVTLTGIALDGVAVTDFVSF